MGSVGDFYDNAFFETINGLFKTEVIHHRGRGPWKTIREGEYAPLDFKQSARKLNSSNKVLFPTPFLPMTAVIGISGALFCSFQRRTSVTSLRDLKFFIRKPSIFAIIPVRIRITNRSYHGTGHGMIMFLPSIARDPDKRGAGFGCVLALRPLI